MVVRRKRQKKEKPNLAPLQGLSYEEIAPHLQKLSDAGYSDPEIAIFLNEASVFSKRGGLWRATLVKNVRTGNISESVTTGNKYLPCKSISKKDKREIATLKEEGWYNIPRPKNRAECINDPRPCPWVGCRYHLAIDASDRTGSIILNFPGQEVWDMKQTCALDVVEELGPQTLEDVGVIMNLTRERIRQLEEDGLNRLYGELVGTELDPEYGED